MSQGFEGDSKTCNACVGNAKIAVSQQDTGVIIMRQDKSIMQINANGKQHRQPKDQ